MTAALSPAARFMVRLTITVVWALVLSKLIRGAWALIKKTVRRMRQKPSTTKK